MRRRRLVWPALAHLLRFYTAATGLDKRILTCYNDSMNTTWWTTSEAVAETGYSRAYLYELASKNKVRSKIELNARLFDRDSLMNYLTEKQQLPRGGPRKKNN